MVQLVVVDVRNEFGHPYIYKVSDIRTNRVGAFVIMIAASIFILISHTFICILTKARDRLWQSFVKSK